MMEFMDLNDKEDWTAYGDYLTMKAVKDTLGRLKSIQKDMGERAFDLANEKKDMIKERFEKRVGHLYKGFNKRLESIKTYTETARGQKLMDKLSFNLGVVMFASFTYAMGRWPHWGFYNFYSFLAPTMIFIRFVDYKPKKLHYFLLDFCYYGTSISWSFVTLFPKNELLYRLAFLYSSGVLGVSTAAFSNALIFHKFDRLVCLITHPVPLAVLWNIRHVTMPYEANIPEEQRRFLSHPIDEPFFSEKALRMNFFYPYLFYFIWAIPYYIFNFVMKAEKIKEQ